MTDSVSSLIGKARRWLLLTLPGSGVRFLIIGAGRGGTSMLAALLDAHPRLAVGMEFRAGFLQGVNIFDGVRVQDVDERLRHFATACRNEARTQRSVRWGNKLTTERMSSLAERGAPPADAARQFFSGQFAATPVIFILRDGRTCVRSKMKRTGQSLQQACDWWRYCVGFRDWLAHSQEKYFEVRYEDLVNDPAGALDPLCRFLGVEFDPLMLAGTSSEKLLPEYRQQGISTGGLDLGGVPEGCERLLATELEALGYLTRQG